jgi:hypothetical protein
VSEYLCGCQGFTEGCPYHGKPSLRSEVERLKRELEVVTNDHNAACQEATSRYLELECMKASLAVAERRIAELLIEASVREASARKEVSHV